MLVDLSNLTLSGLEKKLKHAILDPIFCINENICLNFSYNPFVDGSVVEYIIGTNVFENKKISLNVSHTGIAPAEISVIIARHANVKRFVGMSLGLSTFNAVNIVKKALETRRMNELDLDFRWNSINVLELKDIFRSDNKVSIFTSEFSDSSAIIRVKVGYNALKKSVPARIPLVREEWSLVHDVAFDASIKEEVGVSWKDLVLGRSTELERFADHVIAQIPGPVLNSALIKAVFQAGIDTECLPELQLLKFGSCVNGFASISSDIDLVVCASRSKDLAWFSSRFASVESQRRLAQDFLFYLRDLMMSGGTKSELIQNARIPLLKLFSFGPTKVSVDVTFMNTVCLLNSQLLKSYACLDESIFRLGHMVKAWARKNDLISNPDNMHAFPTSYAWILLCIYFCQVRLAGCPSLLTDDGDAKVVWGCKASLFVDSECLDPFTATTADELMSLPRSPVHLFSQFLNFIVHEAEDLVIDLHDKPGVRDDKPVTIVDPVEITRLVARNVEPDSWAYIKQISQVYIAKLETARNYTVFFATVFGRPFSV